MSTAQDRFKKSKRIAKTISAIRKQLKIAREKLMDHLIGQQGRLKKRHAMDCGRPKCGLCGNPRRTHKNTRTVQEQRLFQKSLDS